MEDQNQYDELLLKDLENETNAREKAVIENWLASSKENLKYYEDLRKLLRLVTIEQTVDKINIDEEWNRFKESVDLKQLSSISTSNAEETSEERNSKGGLVRKIIISIAVAASIILLIGLGIMLATDKKQENQIVASTPTSPKKKDIAPIVKREINNTENPRTIKLTDGSVVVLSPASVISFPEPFVGNARDINLVGKADFKVFKDRLKPFTVFSGDISTTALGTHFTVIAYTSAPNITVMLSEGQVVVKSVQASSNKIEKDVYLLPGQQVVYNKLSASTTVTSFKENNNNSLKKTNGKQADTFNDNMVVSNNDKTPWYMFNNQSLPAVFEQLKEMYRVNIIYSRRKVSKMYFIGKFNKSDSIETILEQVAKLNNLKVKRQNREFIVTK